MNPLRYKLQEAFLGLAPNYSVDDILSYLKDAVKNGEVTDEQTLMIDIGHHNEHLQRNGDKPFNKHDVVMAKKMLSDVVDQYSFEEDGGAGGAGGSAGATGGSGAATGGDSGGSEGGGEVSDAPATDGDSEDATTQRQIGGFSLPLGWKKKCPDGYTKDSLGNCKKK
jgi:hypothetical protein